MRSVFPPIAGPVFNFHFPVGRLRIRVDDNRTGPVILSPEPGVLHGKNEIVALLFRCMSEVAGRSKTFHYGRKTQMQFRMVRFELPVVLHKIDECGPS